MQDALRQCVRFSARSDIALHTPRDHGNIPCVGHFTFGDDLRVTVDEAIALVTAYPAAVVERYDFGTVSGPSAITTLEIGLLVGAKMVGLTMAEARHLIDIAPTAPWHRVPIDARLEDAPPNSQLYFGACQLYEHFKAPGISDAKISKLLHLKRRSLVPILDSVVKNLYKDAACERAAANPELGLQRLYWEAIPRGRFARRGHRSGGQTARRTPRHGQARATSRDSHNPAPSRHDHHHGRARQ